MSKKIIIYYLYFMVYVAWSVLGGIIHPPPGGRLTFGVILIRPVTKRHNLSGCSSYNFIALLSCSRKCTEHVNVGVVIMC